MFNYVRNKKIFENHIFNKELVSKIYKEPSYLNLKSKSLKLKKFPLESGQTWRDSSPRGYKDGKQAQKKIKHHRTLEK